MANVNSSQIAKIEASGRVSSNELGGRARYAYFSGTLPTSVGDTITLTKLPKGARVLGGVFNLSAAQGATATMAIGISGSTGKYRAAAVTNATSQFMFASTQAENFGAETADVETIIATNAAAAWTAATIRGYISYVVD